MLTTYSTPRDTPAFLCLSPDSIRVQFSARAGEILASPGEFRITLTPDETPISDILRGVPVGACLDGSVFSMDQDEFATLASQRKRGRFAGLSLRHDAVEFESIDQRSEILKCCDAVTCRPTHTKWWTTEAPGRCDSILSSSNEGREGAHTEWWATTRDPDVRRFLLAEDGFEPGRPATLVTSPHKRVKDASILEASACLPKGNLAPVTLIRASSSLTSVGLLAWLLQSLDGPVDLGLVSFSTSVGFIECLESCRKAGWLGKLNWSLDRSIQTRLAGQGGHTNILPHLERCGAYHFARRRIHAKWATLRTAAQTVSILSTANWQASHPREEMYVVVTDPAVCAFLEHQQAGLSLDHDAQRSASPRAVAASVDPQVLHTTTYPASRIAALAAMARK